MACPRCKGKLTIKLPIFGGQLKCWEKDCPKTVERLETTTPNKVNGVSITKKWFDDNSDEETEITT